MIDFDLAFEQCGKNKCVDLTHSREFYVAEKEDKRSYLVYNPCPEYPHFSVLNPNEKEITMVAVDSCIYDPRDDERCDFVLYSQDVFCYVELKRGFDPKLIVEKYDKAINQLIETISTFRYLFDYGERVIEAYPCVGYNSCVPQCSASSMAHIKLFEDRFDVDLCAGNQRTF